MIDDAKKLMLVIGGPHSGAHVEVEDYTFAVRLPLPLSAEEIKADDETAAKYALYYRASITLQDDDGTTHPVEFLRAGSLTVRQAIESRLLPAEKLLS